MNIKQIVLVVLGLLAFVSQFARIFTSKINIHNQNVLLVTAHPDDETMFFGPSIRNFLQNENNLHFLVLSNGNAEGLGVVREQEMRKAVELLGGNPENVVVVNDPSLQDGSDWDFADVARHVSRSVEQIDAQTVITFDEHGVSGHENHKSVHLGVVHALQNYYFNNNNNNNEGKEQDNGKDISLLTLYSVPLWRKYLFSLDAIVSRTASIRNVHFTLISSSVDYSTVRRALAGGHKSQMVWFRYLWSFFSRYMIVNDLGEVDVGRGLHTAAMRSNPQKVAKPMLINRATNIQTSVIKPERTSKPVTRQRPQQTLVHADL